MICRASGTIKVAIAVLLVVTLLAAVSFLLWLGLSWRQRRGIQSQGEDSDGQQLLPLHHLASATTAEETHVLLGPLGREGAEGSLPELAAELPVSTSANPEGKPDITEPRGGNDSPESSTNQDQS